MPCVSRFDQWEELLAGMSDEQITSPRSPSPWSVKDEIAHLWAWQQRSIARVEAALHDHEPEFPEWVVGLDPDDEGNTEPINTWIYEKHRDLPWPQVHAMWREGYLRFLESGKGIAEMHLLNSGKYPWLRGCPLAFIYLASYDHHQEHLDKLIALLNLRIHSQPSPSGRGVGGHRFD